MVEPAQKANFGDAVAKPVTRAASSFEFRVTDANHLLAAIWCDQ
jgi:hypothetical protein